MTAMNTAALKSVPLKETPDAEAGNGFACAVSTPINSSQVTAVLNTD